MAIQSSGSADAVRKIVDASQVLSNEGLESWSHVSEDTRKYLSQIPWIREKVNPQEKDTNALQGAGSWSTSPEPIGVTPENDVASINLDIGVPEFSPRRTDSDAPSKKPIAEVLDEVRSTLKYMKEALRNQRAATDPGASVLGYDSHLRTEEFSSSSVPQDIYNSSVQHRPASPRNATAKFERRLSIPKDQATSDRQSRPKARHSKSWLKQLSHRDSREPIDNQTVEIQLFPGEIVTEANWKLIKGKIPSSIRDECIFKEDCWWYDGDPAKLSGINKDGHQSEGKRAEMGNSSKDVHPVIRSGSIMIAGKPLLIESCFHRKNEAWTYDPNVNMMKDIPIPPYKNGETVVVPFESIPPPPKFKWEDQDPISPRIIDPFKYSKADLDDIACHIGPHEFCLWLDGTLQVILSNKDRRRAMTFPRTVGGLKVTFSEGFASNTSQPQSRSRLFKLASDSTSSLRSERSRKSGSQGPKASKPTALNSETEGTVASPPASTANGKAEGTRKPITANGTGAPVETLNSANGTANKVTASEVAEPPAAGKTHSPCRVIIGETVELGVSCFVGVKIRNNADIMITVPTSAALEAACKARKASSHFVRVMKLVQGETAIDVRGLGVWKGIEPHEKIGTITRCFDSEEGRSLHKNSRHPDDFLYDVCLVAGVDDDSFTYISSPSQQWWTKANNFEPSQIVQNTRLHIVYAPKNYIHDHADVVGGKELQRFASSLPPDPPNALYQAVRVVPHGLPRVISSDHHHHSHKPGYEHSIPRFILSTSTLYRFLGPVQSWGEFRGAAVVVVGSKGEWESVVGLHSFEYIAALGNYSRKMGWEEVRKNMLEGSLSFWGCRHLPKELTKMELCD